MQNLKGLNSFSERGHVSMQCFFFVCFFTSFTYLLLVCLIVDKVNLGEVFEESLGQGHSK